MSENKEPDWLGELANGGEALQREAISIVKAAEEMAASARPARSGGGSCARLAPESGELAAPEPVVHELTLATTVTGTASLTGVGTITAVGSIALPPMRFVGEGTVQQPDLIERNIGRILTLVVLAIVTSGLLDLQGPNRATIDHWATIISAGLTIAVLIWAGHK
jgi:magnesium-transporting ATPase (P-type)